MVSNITSIVTREVGGWGGGGGMISNTFLIHYLAVSHEVPICFSILIIYFFIYNNYYLLKRKNKMKVKER